jgi:hypothetical protein
MDNEGLCADFVVFTGTGPGKGAKTGESIN